MTIKKLQDSLKAKYPSLKLSITVTGQVVHLWGIVVPKELRKEGIGSSVMLELIAWADENNSTIILSPSKDFGASSVARLKKFYKRFGFIENKGRNRDYSHSQSMYRTPMTLTQNPPWSNKLIAANIDEIRSSGLPMPTKKELGSGNYGAVYETSDPRVVFKITSDQTEAKFIRKAKAIGEFPDGIVNYIAIAELDGSFRKRKTYGIWREESFNVGLEYTNYARDYESRSINSFIYMLHAFKDNATIARASINRSKDSGQFYKAAKKLENWAWDQVGEEDALGTIGGIDQNYLAARYRGAERVAIALRACAYLAEQMEHNNQFSQQVGAALAFYLEHNILLADVHGNNVGQVVRGDDDDDWDKETLWVITDPGHAVFLNEL